MNAICPTHGAVDAVVRNDSLVCPNPDCHRTCLRPNDSLLTIRTLLSEMENAGESILSWISDAQSANWNLVAASNCVHDALHEIRKAQAILQ